MDKGFKILGEAMARRMHPDLDWPTPNDDVKDKMQRYATMDQLELLWEMSIHPDLEINLDHSIKIMFCTVYKMNPYGVDVEATQKKMARAMKALRSYGATIEKKYSDDYFTIAGTFACGLVYKLMANREVACTKRVVGREYVAPMSGHYREIVEWDCERIAFGALDA